MSFKTTQTVLLRDGQSYSFDSLKKLSQANISLKGFSVNNGYAIIESELGNIQIALPTQLLQLRLNTGNVVECTPDQEFYLYPAQTVRADELNVGDKPMIQLGGDIVIEHITPLSGMHAVGSLNGVRYNNYLLACGLLAKGI